MNRLLLTLLFGFFAGALAAAAPPVPDEMTLVKDGRAKFRIVTIDNPPRELKVGIDAIKKLVGESTDAGIDAISESKLAAAPRGFINLHVGWTDYVQRQGLDFPRPYGFLIHFVDAENIIAAGFPAEGDCFNSIDAASCFLETFLGVRYLMPGEIGTHVPPLPDGWTIRPQNIRKVPDCFVRKLSGHHGQAYRRDERHQQQQCFDWALRMGTTAGKILQHNHNVGNLLDPLKYGKTHPEFFPLIDGKRRIPPELKEFSKWRMLNWEPCYTADGIAEEAAKNIIEYFDAHPEAYSQSLSVNDSGEICLCDKCRAKNRNLPPGSESQSYYEWVAKVTSIVNQKYPDRYFGLLNYWVTREMPSNVKLPANVIPIVCEDLKFYVDPELDKQLEERLAQWDRLASTIGWWDYGFEGAYAVPAYNAHYLAKKIKHLYKNHNLRVYTNELHPGRHWKNAPEVYMLLKLLWDIDSDPDALLNEWFDLAVGPAAAPYLKKYYAIWERFWTEKIPQTTWFKERAALQAPFLQRRDATYLDALEYSDVADSLKLLNQCVDAAPAGKTKLRAEFLRDYFAMAANTYFMPYLNARKLAADADPMPGKTVCEYTFDQDYRPWVPWQSAKHTAKLSLDKNTGHDRPGSLKLDLARSLQTGMVFFRRPLDFKLQPGKNYRISVWCKAKNIDERSFMRMYIYFPLKTGGVLGPQPEGAGRLNWSYTLRYPELKDGKWHKMEVYVAVPEHAWTDVAGIDCQLEFEPQPPDSCGWFDDFKVEELTAPAPELYREFAQPQPPDANTGRWTDPATGEVLGPELMTDGDMEAADARAWRDTHTPQLKAKTRAVRHTGKQSLHVVSDSGGDGVHQILAPTERREIFEVPVKALRKGAQYRVQLWIKYSDPAQYEEVRLPGTGLKTALKNPDQEWHPFVFRVTCDEPQITDFLTIGYGSDRSDCYIDDVSVREILVPAQERP